MRKIKQTALFFISVLVLTGFVACSSDDNEGAKELTVTIESPKNDQEFEPGDTFTLKATITAEAGIEEVKIDIHYGEGHTHTSSLSLRDTATEESSSWSFQEVITDAAGKKSYQLTRTILVPEDAPHGHYHVGVLVTDKEKQELKKYIEILVEGDEEPVIE